MNDSRLLHMMSHSVVHPAVAKVIPSSAGFLFTIENRATCAACASQITEGLGFYVLGGSPGGNKVTLLGIVSG